MDKAIEYVLLKIEEAYYQQNSNIRIKCGSCMKDEGLKCNCITGIAINYAGYLACICCKENCEVKFFMDSGDIGYMCIVWEGKPFMPVTLEQLDSAQYYLENKIEICRRQRDKRRQARIAFREYHSMEKLSKKVRDAEVAENAIMQRIYEKKGIRYCYCFQFWISFLETMRTRSLEDSGKALLAMTIFMFPEKTLEDVRRAVAETDDAGEEELKKTADFLNEYLKFLEKLESVKGGFFFHDFCIEFKKLTGIEIRYFIEEIICNPKVPISQDTLYEILSRALENNLKEKRGSLSEIIDILNERGFKGAKRN